MRQLIPMLKFFHNGQSSQKGSVLLPVLSLIISGSLLTIALLNLSIYNTAFITAHVSAQKSMYLCEGAANRMQYLIAAEREKFPDAELGSVDYSDYEYDRFLPDGIEHVLDYHGVPVKVTIQDAQGGLDFSSQQAAQQTVQYLMTGAASDTELSENLQILQDQLTDYTDSDDSVQDDGLEEAEYEELNRPPLPRNEAMEYREELFYLPGFLKLFPPDKNGRLGFVNPVVPDDFDTGEQQQQQQQQQQRGGQGGQSGQQQMSSMSGVPNIFQANKLYLENALDLEDSEVVAVEDALEDYRTQKILLSDSLEATLYGTLRNSPLLKWDTGSMYTVTVEPCTDEENPAPHKRLTFSYTDSGVSGPEDYVVRYLEWFFY